jgi:uncharacterized protein with HEPN domain
MSRDDSYMLDMLIAARKASEHAAGLSEERFHESALHQDAIIRKLEVIGEAARRVSEATRSQHSQIEWSKITGMRHRLAHDYRNVDLDIVWSVVTTELPALINYLQRVVPPDEPES